MLFPAGDISFSFAAMGVIPEGISKFFSDSGSLIVLMFGVLLWAVILFLLCRRGIVFAVVALGTFVLVIYSFVGLIVSGTINRNAFFWISFASLAIPLLPVLVSWLIFSASGGGGAGSGGGSSVEEKTIKHYDKFGARTGESKVKGDRIKHYDNLGVKIGESKIEDDKVKHYSNWGEGTGESKVQGKTITLYDSRGNLISESHIRGNTIEHRDEHGGDKGSSKIK
jgi:hypothetical protein